MVDFTTVVAVDDQHISELRQVWPTWRLNRPEIFDRPLLVICDAQHKEDYWRAQLAFLEHPAVRVVTWTMPNVSQREKMLSSLVFATAQHVSTPWYLKLDTDVVAYRQGNWLQPTWFVADSQGQLPVFVTNPWGYTKPANAIETLDDWAGKIPGLREYPALNIQKRPDSACLKHKRITSWCFFGRTDWTRQMALLSPGRLPLPSQDTFMWYCAARRKDFYRTFRMAHFGWQHVSHPRRLARRCREVLAQTNSPFLPLSADGLRPNPTTLETSVQAGNPLVSPHAKELIQLISSQLSGPFRGAEIGVSQGRTSRALLKHIPRLFLYMVDPWTTYAADHPYRRSRDGAARLSAGQQAYHREQSEAQTDFAKDRRQIIALDSIQAAQLLNESSLDFAFIDGEHTYAAVRADLHAWWPKIRPGGLLLGHDYQHPRNRSGKFGVRRAVDEWAKAEGLEVQLGSGDLWWVAKPAAIANSKDHDLILQTPPPSESRPTTHSEGVIYLLSGLPHAVRLAVSLYSLRRHWNGPVTVFSTDEACARVVEALASDPRLKLNHCPMIPAEARRNRSYCTKPLLSEVTPYSWTLYLDADTLIVGPLDDLFGRAPLLLTQFSKWVSTGSRMRKRISKWRGLTPEIDTLVSHSLQVPQAAINTGVIGFERGFYPLARWREFAHLGRRKFIVDEIAMQLLYPMVAECLIVDDRWNRSVTYHASALDTRIWHFHGDRHLRKVDGRRLWLPKFEACWRENVGNLQEWAGTENIPLEDGIPANYGAAP